MLGEHAEAVELVGRVGVVGHPHVADHDAAVGMQRRGAALAGAAHDGDLTAVTQRGQHLVALQRGIDDGRDTVGVQPPNAFSHSGSSRDNLVRTEFGDEWLVGGGGVGDHPQPVGFRQLDDVTTDRSCGAGDREGFARRQVQHVEGPAGS